MSVTIFQVAKAAGVSYSTASRVINGGKLGKRGDSKARAELLLKVADELGYEPNSSARSLATKRTGNLCYIMSDDIEEGWGNSYYADYLKGIEASCLKHGYGLLINSYKQDCFKTFFMERGIGQRKFDGLIIIGNVTDEMNELLSKHNVPFLCMDVTRRKGVPLINPVRDVRVEVVKYAADKGHRNIGFAVTPDVNSLRESFLGKIAAIPNLEGVETMDLVTTPLDSSSGSKIFDLWSAFPKSERPTLMGLSHQTAAFFLKELHKNALRCPEDVSVVSTVDSFVCEAMSPALTVVAVDNVKHGEAISDLMVESLKNNIPMESTEFDVPIITIERESVLEL